MSDDPLQYQLYYREALRNVMRRALAVVAEDGLPGEHYFHITFRTDFPGVQLPESLRQQYPMEMAIVLQHVFYDLDVDETSFSVSLSFNKIQQRLTIPLDAVTVFQDPPAGFVLPFHELEQLFGGQADEAGETQMGAPDTDERAAPPDGEAGESGNVIAFDTFQNKNRP